MLYRRVRNWYVAELRSAEKFYYKQISIQLSKRNLSADPHKWWKIAKKSCGLEASETIPPLSVNGRACLTASDKAESLNTVFAQQCSAPAAESTCSRALPELENRSRSERFTFTALTTKDVFGRLSKLNVRKAPGDDGVNHQILKSCAHTLAEPLCHIFNLSLKTGVFPGQWKTAWIQPIYKNKGQRSDPRNYRPIALLPCVSKVFEHFVHKQLLAYSLEAGIIPDEQFGFLPRRSTVWQLLSVLEEFHRALDEGGRIHACFLDISKAFDRVDHGLLLRKLSGIGVKGVEHDWFASYLNDRCISTCVDGAQSKAQPISSGVPQGSVLGPLLFVLFLSDLPSVFRGSSALFADDTLAYDRCTGTISSANPDCSSSSSCCRLQSDLQNVNHWSNQTATTFNPSKSAVMVFRGKRKDKLSRDKCDILLGDSPVPHCAETKHLGVTITQSLSWTPHVDKLLQRVSYKVYILKRLAYRCNSGSEFVAHLYLTLVRPVLEYAGPVWDACSRTDSLRLERAQLSIARAILRASRQSLSNRDVLTRIGWPTLAWRRRRYKLFLFWQLTKGQGPPPLAVPACVSTRASQTLRKRTIEMPLCRSELRRWSFLPSCITLWNSLPLSITSCSSSSSFLSSLDSHFKSDIYCFGL